MASKKLRLDMDSIVEESSPGNTSTSVPFRGKYTRPLSGGGGLTGASRYSPYSISRDRPSTRRTIPLIRATRDEDTRSGSSSLDLNSSSGFGGNSSSTAQKIIETLTSMSTPVLNAGRVRIDSIKPMRPLSLGSPVMHMGSVMSPTSKFSGPPKTSSPLLLPKTLSGVRTSGSENFNWSLRSIGIPPKMVDSATNTEESSIYNEMRGQAPTPSTPTQVVAIVANNTSGIQPGNGLRNPVSTGVKRKFKFSEPWSVEDLKGLKERKHEQKKEESSSSSSSDDLSNDDYTKAPVVVNGERSNTSNSSIIKEAVKPKAAEEITFKFTPSSTAASATEKKWECNTCMVFNKPSDNKCVCCETPNPNAKPTEKPAQDKLDSGMKTSTAAKKWNCPTCMVSNKATDRACVCCTEKNPNPVDSGEDDTKVPGSTINSPASTFKFGFSNSGITAAVTSASTGFTFGSSQPAVSNAAAKTFSFGVQPSNSTNSPVKNQSFGSGSSAPTGFSFGSSSNKPVASTPTTPIKFGLTAEVDKKPEVTPKKIELWQCEVCSAKVKFELHSCECCGSTRPREFDPGYKKPEEKPKSELVFEPVFGLKSSPPKQSPFSSAGSSFPSVSAASAGGSGFDNSTTFGGGTKFSSGNPFGNAGAFGSSGTSTGGLSGNSFGGMNSNTTTTTASIGLFSGGGGPSFSSPGGSSSAPGFQFGSTSPGSPTKRKLDDKECPEGDQAKKMATSGVANFTFGGTSNIPALKLKETPTPQFTPVAPAAVTPTNNPGFLEALKNASAAVKASTEKQSNTVTSTSGPPANKMFTFGTAGSAPAPAPAQGSFFSDPNPAPTAFTFGSSAGGSFTSPSMGMNQGNPPAVAPVAPVAPAAAQFNLTPNFNFGASPAPASTFNFGANPSTGAAGGSAAAPTPFQFSATPTGGPAIGERKIRRATRRFK